MPKIFLSHSSDDKQFVEIIANKFGKDNVVYDKFSFEVGGITFNQIVEALNNSDLFVIFISNKALNSQWVRNELNIAYEYLNLGKLKQIFPIIIDENIDYTDERIPEWMKNGMTAYNLKFVESPLVAYRLINTCFKELKNKVVAPINNYVGHEKELLDFQDKFYGTDSNYVCIVASGLQGIGRTTFIKQCLLKLNIIKPSNEPIVIEFNRNQSIEDMICKIVDIGYGYENIFTLAEKSIAEKIDILLKQFSQIQQFHEFVIFKDEGGLINSQGIVSWLNTVIQKLRHELTFGIASKRQLSYNKIQDKALIYSTNITELDNGNKLNLLQRLTQLDIDSVRYFTKFLSGHPMQVKYCAQLINDLGFEETKNRADLLNEYSFKNVRNILTSTIESLCYNTDDKKSLLLGYLGFLAKYPNIPVNLVLEVNSLNPIYSEIYHNLISLCICQKIGATKDILTTSPIICDYFDRNRIDKAADIEKFLNDKFLEFQNNFNEGTIDEYYYSQVDYNLKNIIVSGVELNKDLRYC